MSRDDWRRLVFCWALAGAVLVSMTLAHIVTAIAVALIFG